MRINWRRVFLALSLSTISLFFHTGVTPARSQWLEEFNGGGLSAPYQVVNYKGDPWFYGSTYPYSNYAYFLAHFHGDSWSYVEVLQPASSSFGGHAHVMTAGDSLFFGGSIDAYRDLPQGGYTYTQPEASIFGGVSTEFLPDPYGSDWSITAITLYQRKPLIALSFVGDFVGSPLFLRVWDGSSWQDMSTIWRDWDGSTENARIHSFAHIDGDLYAVGNVRDGGILRYTGQNWIRAEGAFPAHTLRLCQVGESIYASNGIHVYRVGESSPEDLGGLGEGTIAGMINFRGELHVYGSFTTIDGVPASRIARFDGVGWHPLDTGTNSTIRDALETERGLVVVGTFEEAGGKISPGAAVWTGSQWEPFVPVGHALGGGGIGDFAEFQNMTVAVGTFGWTGSGRIGPIVAWHENDWIELAHSSEGGIREIVGTPEYLYAYGSMESIDGVACEGFARFDGTVWEAVPPPPAGVNCLMGWQGNLLAVGAFDMGGPQLATVIVLENGIWTELGSSPRPRGNSSFYGGGNTAIVDGDDLLLGGQFEEGEEITFLYRWDGVNWIRYDTGLSHEVRLLIPLETGILAATVYGTNRLVNGIWNVTKLGYLGRQVYSKDTVFKVEDSSEVMRSVGDEWETIGVLSLGEGIQEDLWNHPEVRCMKYRDGKLWLGGKFMAVDGTPSSGLAVWADPTVLSVGDDEPPVPEGPSGDRGFRIGVWPNPFRGEVRLSLDSQSFVELSVEVIDASGRRVRRLHSGKLEPGHTVLQWNGRDGNGRSTAAGVYYFRVIVDGRIRNAKIVRIP